MTRTHRARLPTCVRACVRVCLCLRGAARADCPTARLSQCPEYATGAVRTTTARVLCASAMMGAYLISIVAGSLALSEPSLCPSSSSLPCPRPAHRPALVLLRPPLPIALPRLPAPSQDATRRECFDVRTDCEPAACLAACTLAPILPRPSLGQWTREPHCAIVRRLPVGLCFCFNGAHSPSPSLALPTIPHHSQGRQAQPRHAPPLQPTSPFSSIPASAFGPPHAHPRPEPCPFLLRV